MRFGLLILLCSFTLSASAQIWRFDFKKHERFPPLNQVTNISASHVLNANISKPRLRAYELSSSEYRLELQEASVMKAAQHNMRFRIYNIASYNFSDLADLYIQQNRLSEAKWYLLQSNLISRQQNDDKHTISNLVSLAQIKAEIGHFVLAQEDLMEARDISCARGHLIDLIEIEKKLRLLQRNRISTYKTDMRYAEVVDHSNQSNL